MYYKKNLDETKRMFDSWWRGENKRPLLNVTVKKDPANTKYQPKRKKDNEDAYTNAELRINNFFHEAETTDYLFESFPNVWTDFGPGSLAYYLGAEPEFLEDTVWCNEVLHSMDPDVHYTTDLNNKWFVKHLNMVKKMRQLSEDKFYVTMPDIIEGIDIYSELRGPANTCYDLMDNPKYVMEKLEEIDATFMDYYNAFYDEIVLDDYQAYVAFNILGKGKTTKVQCDFSTMLSPDQYNQFVAPNMVKHLKNFDNAIYHLDGKDAIRHADTVLSYKDLNALQWTPGAGQPDCANEIWYPLFDKVKKAGKGIWIAIYDGNADDWIRQAKKFVDRYGHEGLYINFPSMSYEDVNRLTDALNI